MPIVIRQPAGLGDILFCQKIAWTHKAQGNRVIWPVIPQYSFIGNYLPDYEFPVIYYTQPEDVELQVRLTGPGVNGTGVMQSKYEALNMEWRDWKKFVNLKRNMEIEESLAYSFVDIEDFPICENEYALVCKSFASPPETLIAPIEIKTELPIIEISPVDGFTPFDWCLLIENATELHLVDTCFTYLCELVNLKARRMCLYPRLGYEAKIRTKELWSVKWEFMDD